MLEIKNDPQKVERAFLVGIQESGMTTADAEDHLRELESLVETMGVPIVGEILVRVDRPQAKFYVGTGKAAQIMEMAKELEADVVIFDNELAPSQQRNWEKESELCVIDRQEVILDIFADRAQTREATLQVALARMEYSLPRLRRAWTHLERQRGGAGQRGGMGEMQLEIDQRVVRDKIARLKRQLKEVRQQRDVSRKSRGNRPVPVTAIVGYTNVGKSSLLRKITGADVLVENKLFATLDTTTRRITLPNNQPLLLTDTVGFVRRLPHDLVEAFKATLEEAALADFILQVLDISHPRIEEHLRVTQEILEELNAVDKKMILVLNKIDREHDPWIIGKLKSQFPLIARVSTITNAGIDDLLAMMAEQFILPMRRTFLHVPHARGDIIDLLHRQGDVHQENYDATGGWFEVSYPERYQKQMEPYIVEGLPQAVAPNQKEAG